MTTHPLTPLAIVLLAISSFIPSGSAQDPTPSIPPSTHRRMLPQPVPTPAPEKLRDPINVTFGELSGFGYDPEDRAFYFTYEGERYWFHISRIDPDSKPETGLLFLQQMRESKVLRIKALAEPVNGYVIVKNIVLYF